MDMSQFVVPRSDQLNSDDLLSGPRTIKITKVSGTGASDQPVAVYFDGDSGKPYKPCKSMRRVMIAGWGVDAAQYVGRSMTLFCDPEVVFGGMKVGGIRISAMSHIAQPLNLALTVTKARRAPYRVSRIAEGAPTAAARRVPAPEEPADEHAHAPSLYGPDGAVFPETKDGLASWHGAWKAELNRVDRDTSEVVAALAPALSAAAQVFAGAPNTVKWIEDFGVWARETAEMA